jgi:hypothetical protein
LSQLKEQFDGTFLDGSFNFFVIQLCLIPLFVAVMEVSIQDYKYKISWMGVFHGGTLNLIV